MIYLTHSTNNLVSGYYFPCMSRVLRSIKGYCSAKLRESFHVPVFHFLSDFLMKPNVTPQPLQKLIPHDWKLISILH